MESGFLSFRNNLYITLESVYRCTDRFTKVTKGTMPFR
jgi:hypothetical protein